MKSAGSDLIASAANDSISKAKNRLEGSLASNNKLLQRLQNQISALETDNKEIEDRIKALDPKKAEFNQIKCRVFEKTGEFISVRFEWQNGDDDNSRNIAIGVAAALADVINRSKYFDKNGQKISSVHSANTSFIKPEYKDKFMKLDGIKITDAGDVDKVLSIIK